MVLWCFGKCFCCFFSLLHLLHLLHSLHLFQTQYAQPLLLAFEIDGCVDCRLNAFSSRVRRSSCVQPKSRDEYERRWIFEGVCNLWNVPLLTHYCIAAPHDDSFWWCCTGSVCASLFVQQLLELGTWTLVVLRPASAGHPMGLTLMHEGLLTSMMIIETVYACRWLAW